MDDLYPVEKSAKPMTCCVTGASGYVASQLVARLLRGGHTVRGTVRRADDPKVAFLKALPGADRLTLHEADLLKPGSFDSVVDGCDVVMHTASPFIMRVPKGKTSREVLVEPALQGVEHVLAACSKAKSVKRVVMTSSVVAVYGDPEERGAGHVFTEQDHNITSTEDVLPYAYSKTVAEQKAWELAKAQSSWDLVTINPGLVMGPPAPGYRRADSESIDIVTQLCTGKMPAAPHGGHGIVDVRDVAAAHVLAALTPSASGRYITVAKSPVDFMELANEIRAVYSNYKLPTRYAPTWLVRVFGGLLGLPADMRKHMIGKDARFDNSKIVKELQIRFLPLATTMVDMVEALAAIDMLPKGVKKDAQS